MPDKKTKSWENDMNGLKILIIGGGVAGLAAMKTLRNVGFDPVLVEKADKIKTDGTGIPSRNQCRQTTHGYGSRYDFGQRGDGAF